MFSNLYLLSGYNNYINRTLKILNTVMDYLDNYDAASFSGINFNPNDEISTEQILNIDDTTSYDYLIVEGEDDRKIKSRWFIIDKIRIRNGQWRFILRRDVVADYINVIKSAPCFIEKATLSFDDPRIFNSEDMTFNQIKKKEDLLKDKSGCAWIVGYYANDSKIKGDSGNNVGTIPTNNTLSIPFIQLDTTLDGWEFYNTTNLSPSQTPINVYYNFNYRFIIRENPYLTNNAGYYITVNESAQVTSQREGILRSQTSLYATENNSNKQALQDGFAAVCNSTNIANLNSITKRYLGSQDTLANELLTYQGKTIRTIDGKVYSIKIIITTMGSSEASATTNSNLFLGMKQITDQVTANGVIFGTADENSLHLINGRIEYRVELTEIVSEELTYDMATAAILTTSDSPYNIFAIPYGSLRVYSTAGGTKEYVCGTEKEIAINAAMAIQKNNPGIVYDIQILPYCPVQSLLSDTDNEICFSSIEQYSTIKKGDSIKGVIINVPASRFTFNIIHSIKTATSAIERKVNNQCDKWRLAAPNYNTYFDFSVEMNNGVDYFNVDCEYKPYSPYIHVNPNFKSMYGDDYNDPRGLVCGGDYSIAAIVDQWQQYQIQNKNFQNIFDRQIENMNITNNIQREKEYWSIAAGILQGTMSGVTSGALVGGGWGALAGGIVGAAGSAFTGQKDFELNEKLRNEAVDFTKDNFGYQLGNIQALPNTLSRISAFNNNNKLFPVLEYYTCTDVEKEALRNKIKYNGMTVMTIGTFEEFMNYDTYVKGKIIRLPALKDDFHVANTIVHEINQGIYILGGFY